MDNLQYEEELAAFRLIQMPEVISFANMKGGVGKTTLCVSLAYELFQRGNRVLVVDNDPQFNATSALVQPTFYLDSILKKPGQHTIYHIYERELRVRGAKKTKRDPKRSYTRVGIFGGTARSAWTSCPRRSSCTKHCGIHRKRNMCLINS